MLLKLSSILCVVALAAVAAPKPGERAPDFSLASINGESMRLSEAISKGPVILIALRGYPGYQCPYCNRQVQDFMQHAQEFASVTVILVYPGPAADLEKHAQEFTGDKPMPANFHLLLDPDYRFTELYGLRWDAKGETAYPSTFLIDEKGIVSFAKVSTSHGGRTRAAEMAAMLKQK